MIITKPKIKIVATILAKNEEDIIGANIEHHANQGVSQFIITDNNSSDKTKEIISKYSEVVEVIEEKGDDHRQSEWVTRMAKLACKLKPDWIIHLDADELWCGLSQLRHLDAKAFGSTKMFLHPPCRCKFDLHVMRYYLDFENISNLPGECKVGHRPDPDLTITHGNHGFVQNVDVTFTKNIWRHHYPVRSRKQFIRKTCEGHEALKKRNAICERWQRWYNLYDSGKLSIFYDHVCDAWEDMIRRPNIESLLQMMELWSTPNVIQLLKNTNSLPSIGEWPRSINAKQSNAN
jgi:glycosyltransferase involved in cell wall biosynthesis